MKETRIKMDAMPLILSIETAALACSAALFKGGEAIGSKHDVESSYVHAERLLPLIHEVLEETAQTKEDLSAVIVSEGPGSYTGLRIGVATAKGLCNALRIPLISMDTLESLSVQARRLKNESWDAIICVLDARRDEVYTATFGSTSNRWKKVQETRALVIDPETPFEKLFPFAANCQKVIVIGDAAQKTKRLMGESANHWTFIEAHPNALDAGHTAVKKMSTQAFEDVAYFEPKYLKEFIAGKPRDPFGLRQHSIDIQLKP